MTKDFVSCFLFDRNRLKRLIPFSFSFSCIHSECKNPTFNAPFMTLELAINKGISIWCFFSYPMQLKSFVHNNDKNKKIQLSVSVLWWLIFIARFYVSQHFRALALKLCFSRMFCIPLTSKFSESIRRKWGALAQFWLPNRFEHVEENLINSSGKQTI